MNLSFLKVDGTPLASKYAFEYNNKFYSYVSARDPAFNKYGVGNILIWFLIKYCIQKNIKEYDFFFQKK